MMLSCPNCKCTFKNLSNHVAQGLCQSRFYSIVFAVEQPIVDSSRSNPVNENNNALNMSLLPNNGNVLLHQENRVMTSISMSVGNGHHNVDSDDNSSVSVIINNDVDIDDEGNLLGRTSFVDHENAHSEDNSIASDNDVDTIFSELEENSVMSNSMIDGVNYHEDNH